MKPDYEHAAMMAADTLVRFGIDSAPVAPLHILKDVPNTIVLSYEDVSNIVSQDRSCVISTFGEKNQDAFTSVHIANGTPHYIVTYNQRLPFFLHQRALARELGHIVLGHVGSLPEDVRNEEAKAFAHHLLMPRALIHAIQASGIRLTTEVVNNLTGCNDYCMACMRKLPPVHVPADLNRAVRDHFMPYIKNFFEYQRTAAHHDTSALADLGNYMEGYEE